MAEHERGARFGRYDPDAFLAGPPWFSPRTGLLLPVFASLVIQLMATAFQFASIEGPGWRAFALGGAALDVRPWRVLVALGFAVAGPLVLLASRRRPGPVVAIVLGITLLDVLVDPEILAPFVAAAFAIVLAMVRGARAWAFASVAAAWGLGVIGVTVLGVGWPPGRLVATTIGMLLVLGIGEFARTRRIRLIERARVARARRQSAAEQERVRIARELHDVLAHSLSQINVQAGVGLHLVASKPEAAAEALANIKATSKQALDEVRSVLGVLRTEGDAPLDPQPGLDGLDALVARTRGDGLEVVLREQIAGPLPESVQHAVYRIVQEALTNVVRHSGARRAEVTLAQTADAYVLAIVDDGRGGEAEPGNGILGMTERVQLLGGTLRSGARAGGGYEVRATLPRTSTRGGDA